MSDQFLTLIGHALILATAVVNLIITLHVRRNTNGRLASLEEENARLRTPQVTDQRE